MKPLRITFLTAILTLIFLSTTIAQQFEFRVMATKGKIELEKSGSKKWNKLKVGSKIFKNDKIKISGKSYLSLVYKTGKTIELKKSGTYNISKLAKKVSTSKSNVSKRFTNYILDEVGGDEDFIAGNDFRKNMGITGSVERSLDNQPFMNKNILQLNSPRKVNFVNTVFTFRWHQIKNVKKYEFILTDRFDKPVFSKFVYNNSITIDASEANLDRDTYYFWKVKAESQKEYKSDDACFLILSKNRTQAIKDTVKMIEEEVGNTNSPSAQIILGAFYEQNYIIDQALKSYRQAVALAPDVKIYKKLYKRFLNRIKVTEK